MKPLGIKNYGSIGHLSNSKLGEGDRHINEGQERILTIKARDKHDTIIVTEKYDGSNVGICKINGEIIALTRSGYTAVSSPYEQHHIFNEWVKKNSKYFDMLDEGERITGEWLYQAHGLKYNIDINLDPILFFDCFYPNNRRYIYFDLRQKLMNTPFMMPRILHVGDAIKVDDILPILNKNTPWFDADGNPEGMVYRVERKNKIDILAKWVRPDFNTGKYIINADTPIYNIDKSLFL